jgi:hypothetical protein
MMAGGHASGGEAAGGLVLTTGSAFVAVEGPRQDAPQQLGVRRPVVRLAHDLSTLVVLQRYERAVVEKFRLPHARGPLRAVLPHLSHYLQLPPLVQGSG